jgi:ketosteroid isomerase-like protein
LGLPRARARDTQPVPDEGASVMRSWFETWNRGDLDAFAALYARDAVMTPPAGWVETGTLDGREQIRQFFAGLKEAWEGEDSAVLNELSRAGDLIVTRMEWRVRGRVSGIETQLALTNVNAIERGQIVRQQHYLDHSEALAAIESSS